MSVAARPLAGASATAAASGATNPPDVTRSSGSTGTSAAPDSSGTGGSSGAADWYAGRRVFITGHTGFKGAWLAAWLRAAGADVTGYALPAPADRPSLYRAARVDQGIHSIAADICDRPALDDALRTADPEIVFHLAAQSLVRPSYRDPVETYRTNVLGTAQLLDCVRRAPGVRALVSVTSDKCYENRGTDRRYDEDDAMGGHDPYSSSKGCAELVTSAMRRSYFLHGDVAVASARAGNVIGGGDWAEDRLVPDLMRAAAAGVPAPIRNPAATRPWQFVLEPLRGYLVLGRALVEQGQAVAEAWNFGPRPADTAAVRDVVRMMQQAWGDLETVDASDASAPHEAALLAISSSKAALRLGWEPALTLAETVALTVDWYREHHADPQSAAATVDRQLRHYAQRAATLETHA